MTEKIPPVLLDNKNDFFYERMKAQRDADVAYCEKKRIEWTRGDRSWLTMVKGWRTPEAVNTLIQQAQEEVAREIFEEIEKRWGYFTDKLEKIIVDDGGYYGRPNSIKDYQALKSKHLKG